jgi:hypothetical protein
MTNVLPIRLREPLFVEPAGRPGDWWEPVGLPAIEVEEHVRREAAARRLPLDLLFALLVERMLVTSDIADCALEAEAARAVLAAEAASLASAGPGRLLLSYVRVLRTGERNHEPESELQLARRDLVLPLRLHEAVRCCDLRAVCSGGGSEEAIRWEVAAATGGQLMREWALRALLAHAAS